MYIIRICDHYCIGSEFVFSFTSNILIGKFLLTCTFPTFIVDLNNKFFVRKMIKSFVCAICVSLIHCSCCNYRFMNKPGKGKEEL